MKYVIVAKLAVLLQLHAIRIRFFVLVRDVVSLFAFRASKRYGYAHDATSHET